MSFDGLAKGIVTKVSSINSYSCLSSRLDFESSLEHIGGWLCMICLVVSL